MIELKKKLKILLVLKRENACEISAKSGLGVDELFETLIDTIPAPEGSTDNPLQGLIFDSWFDPYQGVVILVRVFEGSLKKKDKIFLKHSGQEYEILKVAVNKPFFTEVDGLRPEMSGCLFVGLKQSGTSKLAILLLHLIKKILPTLLAMKKLSQWSFVEFFPVDSQ